MMETKVKTTKRGSHGRPLRRPPPASSTTLSLRSVRPVRRADARAKNHLQLEHDVQKLRTEVARLQQLRQLLEHQALNRADNHAGSACRLVKTYFDVFQRGYVPPSLSPSSNLRTGATFHPGGNRFHPDEFLFSIMDENVLGGGFRGVHIMIEQWKRYVSAFVGTKIQFLTAVVSSVDVDPESGSPSRIHVTATAKYAGHLTLAGIEGMFPHVLTNAPLVVDLIGQNITGLGRYEFVYDCDQKRIVETEIQIDLISAFSKVIANANDLALLFGEALLTAQYYMGDDSEELAQSVRRGGRRGGGGEDDSPPTTPTTITLTSDEEEHTGKQMRLDRILCEEE